MADTIERKQAGDSFPAADRAACMEAMRAVFALNPVPMGAAVKLYLRNFQSFNNTFGYQRGEELLLNVAEFLCVLPGAVFRTGVNYVVLLTGSDTASAMAAAQQIVNRFERPWRIGEIDCVFEVDVGVVQYPEYAGAPGELLHNLDLATEQSGRTGFNQVTMFGPDLLEKLYRRSIIAKLLGSAVTSGNIEIRYRPTYNSEKGRYTRAECQMRLLTVEFGPVKAEEFTPIAEESGIICFVNEYVIEHACSLIRELIDEGIAFESIAVPVSPVMFVQERFVPVVAAMLEQYRIPPEKLSLEIYESPLIAPCARMVMEKLHKLGVELAMGSFGLDYSGLRDILTLPMDVFKLKRQFIWQLEVNPRSAPVIEGLIRIMRELDVKLIAEGVETQSQSSLLSRYHCPYSQGFYYSPTVTARELRDMLR